MTIAEVTLDEFIGMLGNGVVGHAALTERTLREATAVIEGRAKAMLGHERPEWPPLAEWTQDQRAALGFTPNDPLLRSGELQRAVESEVELNAVGGEAVTGVKDGEQGDIAVWMELGTPAAPHPAPPRPFLSLAVIDEMAKLGEIFGEHLVGGLFASDQNAAPISVAPIPNLPTP